MRLRFNVLGQVEAVGPDGPIEVGTPLQRKVLAVLLANPNQIVSADRVIEEVWGGDPPPKARHSLQTYVSNLRRVLLTTDHGQDLIETTRPGYRINVETTDLDALEFTNLIAEGKRIAASLPEKGIDLLKQALSLWRGDPYLDMADEIATLHSEALRLSELRMNAIESRLELELAMGRHNELIGELESLTSSHPLRERLWGMLMIALYRSHRQGDALHVYQAARRALGEQLGIEPTSDLSELEERILLDDRDLMLSVEPAPPNNIPEPLSSFVGRRDEMIQVKKLIADSRLVTITGAPGAGKTRLALEVARSNVAAFRDGTWLVRLGPIRDGTQIATEILGAVGFDTPVSRSPLDALCDQLAGRESLLVLDNCEHLLEDARDVIVAILQRASAVRVVATSREPLAITGEVVFGLRPMPLPDFEDTSLADAIGADAVRLFVDRASAVRSDLTLGDAQVRAIVDICRRLDGLPLAIELAAARTESISIDDIRRRLDDGFRLLAFRGRVGESHHRTLLDTIEWSYDLLDQRPKRLYQRLSVFPGTFPLEGAEAVGAFDEIKSADVLDLLTDLVVKSLVVFQDGRYHMLETVRDHAREKLTDSGHEDGARAALLEWTVSLARESSEVLSTPDSIQAIDRLQVEHDNIQTSLDWALDNVPEDGLRLIVPMTQFWWIDHPLEQDPAKKSSSYLRMGSRWSKAMLEGAAGSANDELLYAQGLIAAGLLSFRLGEFADATSRLESAEVLLAGGDHLIEEGRAVLFRACSSWSYVPFEETIALLRRALDLCQRAGHQQGAFHTMLVLAWALILSEVDVEEGLDQFRRFDEAARQLGHPVMVAHAADSDALFKLILDADRGAVPSLLREAIREYDGIGHRGCMTHAFQCVALNHIHDGDLRKAAVMMGATEGIRERLAIVVAPYEDRSDLVERAGLAAMEPKSRQEAVLEGRSLGYHGAVDLALKSLV